jgi:hypothetical protein
MKRKPVLAEGENVAIPIVSWMPWFDLEFVSYSVLAFSKKISQNLRLGC